MSTTRVPTMPDFFEIGARLTTPQRVSALHVEAIGPSARATCTTCRCIVHARPVLSSPGSCAYILPIDEQGRCPTCSWANK